jgi:hypothetical protein
MKLEIFSISFRKIPQMSNFMKILPVRAELFHADGQKDGLTDITRLIVTFSGKQNPLNTKCVF